MTKIAIIPARGGSKRIPKKNIRLFLGKPIIAYSIEAAISSKLFDLVIVSTDDIEIAEIAKKYEPEIRFVQSCRSQKKRGISHAGLAGACVLALLNYVLSCYCCNFKPM